MYPRFLEMSMAKEETAKRQEMANRELGQLNDAYRDMKQKV